MPTPMINKAIEATRRRILFVEDQPELLSTYERAFRHHEIVLAPTAERALHELERDPAFDLVVCDVVLPSLDGVELYHRVCRLYPALASRFIFATGATGPQRTQVGLDKLDVPVLEKPFGMSKLRAMLDPRPSG